MIKSRHELYTKKKRILSNIFYFNFNNIRNKSFKSPPIIFLNLELQQNK